MSLLRLVAPVLILLTPMIAKAKNCSHVFSLDEILYSSNSKTQDPAIEIENVHLLIPDFQPDLPLPVRVATNRVGWVRHKPGEEVVFSGEGMGYSYWRQADLAHWLRISKQLPAGPTYASRILLEILRGNTPEGWGWISPSMGERLQRSYQAYLAGHAARNIVQANLLRFMSRLKGGDIEKVEGRLFPGLPAHARPPLLLPAEIQDVRVDYWKDSDMTRILMAFDREQERAKHAAEAQVISQGPVLNVPLVFDAHKAKRRNSVGIETFDSAAMVKAIDAIWILNAIRREALYRRQVEFESLYRWGRPLKTMNKKLDSAIIAAALFPELRPRMMELQSLEIVPAVSRFNAQVELDTMIIGKVDVGLGIRAMAQLILMSEAEDSGNFITHAVVEFAVPQARQRGNSFLTPTQRRTIEEFVDESVVELVPDHHDKLERFNVDSSVVWVDSQKRPDLVVDFFLNLSKKKGR